MYQIIGIAIFIMVVFLLGQVLWALLPFILIYMVVKAVLNYGKPKKAKRTTFYYGNTKTNNDFKDFEEFFRQAGGNGNYGNFGGNTNNQGPYRTFEDTSKYYNILGVESSASQDEIKKAYRGLARKHHPDRYATADEDIRAHHERKFKEINEAYDKISK